MRKILPVIILIIAANTANAQSAQFPENPSPSWFIIDSSIKNMPAFTDTLLKGARSLYLFQKSDSMMKGQNIYTFHYVSGNGTPLNFIYTYVKHDNAKVVDFIEIDGNKEDVMNICNYYFRTKHYWDEEKANHNVRQFVYGEKKYILRMSENADADGNLLGTVRCGMMRAMQ